MREKFVIDSQKLIDDLIANFDQYHDLFFLTEFTIDGPSNYFYSRTLKTKYPSNIELIYATLVSWGMHRMGKGGAKMIAFDQFNKSILSIEPNFRKLETKRISELNDDDLFHLKEIFMNLKVMRSNSFIVAHSKVMANLLPNIVPPIDRQYTMDFFGIKNTYQVKWRGLEEEWSLFESMFLSFFKPLSQNEVFQKKAFEKKDSTQWDSSIPKIIDNLIIGKGAIFKKNKQP